MVDEWEEASLKNQLRNMFGANLAEAPIEVPPEFYTWSAEDKAAFITTAKERRKNRKRWIA